MSLKDNRKGNTPVGIWLSTLHGHRERYKYGLYPDSWLTSWSNAQEFRKDQTEASVTKRHMRKGQVSILITLGMGTGYEVLVFHVNA